MDNDKKSPKQGEILVEQARSRKLGDFKLEVSESVTLSLSANI